MVLPYIYKWWQQIFLHFFLHRTLACWSSFYNVALAKLDIVYLENGWKWNILRKWSQKSLRKAKKCHHNGIMGQIKDHLRKTKVCIDLSWCKFSHHLWFCLWFILFPMLCVLILSHPDRHLLKSLQLRFSIQKHLITVLDCLPSPSEKPVLDYDGSYSSQRFRKPLLQFCIIVKVFRVAFAILSCPKVLLSRNICLHNSLPRSFRADGSCSAYKFSRSFRGKWLRMHLRLCFRALSFSFREHMWVYSFFLTPSYRFLAFNTNHLQPLEVTPTCETSIF